MLMLLAARTDDRVAASAIKVLAAIVTAFFMIGTLRFALEALGAVIPDLLYGRKFCRPDDVIGWAVGEVQRHGADGFD